MSWKAATLSKRERLLSQIPPAWRLDHDKIAGPSLLPDVTGVVASHLNVLEQQITQCSTVQLLQDIERGNFTSREVLSAFSHRAALAHQFVSANSVPLLATVNLTAS